MHDLLTELTPYLTAILSLVVMSAFFSGSEISFSAANRVRLESAMESGSGKARVACWILDHFDDALSTLLIGNNLVNISASSIATVIALILAGGGEQYTAVAAWVIAVILIIFGETMPKIAAKKNANRFAIAVAYILRALMALLRPVVALVVFLNSLIIRPFRGERDELDTVEELFQIIETVEDEGVIDEQRSDLLQAALEFTERAASEAMTARVDVVALDIEDDWNDQLRTIDESPYSRLPVYEGSMDNVVGILSLNHFYKARTLGSGVDIRSLLMEPCYVYKTHSLSAVLEEMRRRKMHLAIVTDEYGGTMGLLTMKDVMEQLLGGIWDVDEEGAEPELVERGSGLYEIDGDMAMGDFFELTGIKEFDTDSATVGGWTLEIFGRYPLIGDTIVFNGIKLDVLQMDGLRVEKVLVDSSPKEGKAE